MASTDQIDEARTALERMQMLDSASVGRGSELGARFSFEPVVPLLTRMVDLYRQLPLDILPDLSRALLDQIKHNCNSEYQRVEQMLAFDPGNGNAIQERENFLSHYRNSAYDNAFDVLNPAIAFAVRRSMDFEKLDRDARAASQSAKDQAAELLKQLAQRQSEADAAIAAIRQASAEAGVSQQASYFHSQAEQHDEEARSWLYRAVGAAVLLLVAALASPLLTMPDPVRAVQLTLGKVFALGAIAYVAVLCTRTFQAHTHNAVVNRHRENGLKTYKALVEAAGDGANRDIVLTRAAECIFSPQQSGFSAAKDSEATVSSMVSLGQAAARPSGSAGS